MKRFNRVIASIACVALLFTTVMTAYAAEPVVAVPNGSVLQCKECLEGTIRKDTTKTYEHDELFSPCTHYPNNADGTYDIYKVYEVEEKVHCTKCSYVESERKYEEHILVECHGHP